MRLTLVLILSMALMIIGCNGDSESSPSPKPTPTLVDNTPIQSETPVIPDPTPIDITPDPEITRDNIDEILFSEEGTVSVELTSDRLTITNNTPDIVYYYVWPVNIVGLIDWFPCENPQQCEEYNSIEADKDAQIEIEKNATDLIVNWWQLIHNPDGTTSADSVHEVLIEIP